jgi:hypothetical protein
MLIWLQVTDTSVPQIKPRPRRLPSLQINHPNVSHAISIADSLYETCTHMYVYISPECEIGGQQHASAAFTRFSYETSCFPISQTD